MGGPRPRSAFWAGPEQAGPLPPGGLRGLPLPPPALPRGVLREPPPLPTPFRMRSAPDGCTLPPGVFCISLATALVEHPRVSLRIIH